MKSYSPHKKTIRALLKRNHWSISDLARECEVHRSTISRYLSGARKGVSAETCDALQRAVLLNIWT